jgi:hypothetical protein
MEMPKKPSRKNPPPSPSSSNQGSFVGRWTEAIRNIPHRPPVEKPFTLTPEEVSVARVIFSLLLHQRGRENDLSDDQWKVAFRLLDRMREAIKGAGK